MAKDQETPEALGTRQALIRRFWATASGFWSGDMRVRAWALTLGLTLVSLSQIAVQYRINFWTRDIFDAVEQRNAAGLRTQALLLLPLTAMTVALAVAAVYGRMSMQREWRGWLVRRLIGRWVKQGRSHQMNLIKGNHQVPEGRITDDARIATDAPVDFMVGLFNSLVGAITFIGILWVVGGALDVTLGSLRLRIPGYLVVSVIVYSVLVTLVMLVFTRNFTAVSESINQAEAEFRFGLTHVRENGESIALLGGEAEEQHGLKQALAVVIERWRRYCRQHMRVTVVSNSNMLIAPVLPIFLCMPRFLDGQMTLGEVTQAAAAFVQVQSSFNWLVDNFARFADWRASARRVGTLLTSLDDLWRQERSSGPGRIQRTEIDGAALRLRNLTVAVDGGHVALREPEIVLDRAERVQVIGESDSDKAALLRAIAGLSHEGEGEIGIGRHQRLLVMPQHPFIPVGTLRRIASYPAHADARHDAELRALLDASGLGSLRTRLDSDEHWDQLLGSGERQRLAFVRACFTAPGIILLDEATSALDPESQRQLMALLIERLPDAAIMSFSHHKELATLFSRTLHFDQRPGRPPVSSPAAG